jgi:hypothetical protein
LKQKSAVKIWIDRNTRSTKDYLRHELLRLKSSKPGERFSAQVLDIGSSSGDIWKHVASGGWLNREGIELKVTLFDAHFASDGQEMQSEGLSFESIRGVAPSGLSIFTPGVYDLVTAFDIIEHLTKDQGYHLLYELNRLAPTSVIRCPNGFVWQPPFESNPFQAHISSWTPRELRSLGWKKQYGESGLRYLIGIGTIPNWITSQSRLRRRFSFLERMLLVISQLWLYVAPSLMAEVVAIRRSRAFDLEAYIESGKTNRFPTGDGHGH